MCPILTAGATLAHKCQAEECAWYDEVDYHCAIVTIADNLANIHGHARECFAKAYGLDNEVEED